MALCSIRLLALDQSSSNSESFIYLSMIDVQLRGNLICVLDSIICVLDFCLLDLYVYQNFFAYQICLCTRIFLLTRFVCVLINLRVLKIFGFFPPIYKLQLKILYETQQNIYIQNQSDEIYKMTRSINCRDLRNFLEFKKLDV